MKKIMPLLILMISLCSCLSTERYNEIVTQAIQDRYPNDSAINKNNSSEYLLFKRDGLPVLDTIVQSKTLKKTFVPALVFWYWNHAVYCQIDPSIPANIFMTEFNTYADSLKLVDKLGDQKLEIILEKIPSDFYYSRRSWYFFYLLGYAGQESEMIHPSGDYLAIRYRILNDSNEIKKGTISARNKEKPVRNTVKLTEKFTRNFIVEYDENLRSLSREIVDKLMEEI